LPDRHGRDDRAEAELRARLDALECRLIGVVPRDAHDDVRPTLRGDLRLADTGVVDAVADDPDRLVELLLRDGLAAGELRREDDLRPAVEVKRELQPPGRVAPQHPSTQD